MTSNKEHDMTIDWTAIATEAINAEGSDAYDGRSIDQLAADLEAGYEAGTVIYAVTDDDIDFRVLSLPAR